MFNFNNLINYFKHKYLSIYIYIILYSTLNEIVVFYEILLIFHDDIYEVYNLLINKNIYFLATKLSEKICMIDSKVFENPTYFNS